MKSMWKLLFLKKIYSLKSFKILKLGIFNSYHLNFKPAKSDLALPGK